MFWLFGVSLLSSVMKLLWWQEHSENRKRKKKNIPLCRYFPYFTRLTEWSPTARECVSRFPIKDRRYHTLFSAHGRKRKWQWLWSAFHALFDNVSLDKILREKNKQTVKQIRNFHTCRAANLIQLFLATRTYRQLHGGVGKQSFAWCRQSHHIDTWLCNWIFSKLIMRLTAILQYSHIH